jgi:thioredoxin-related protein
MKLKLIASLCAAVTACVVMASEKPAIEGAELGKWTMDVAAAKTLAKETGKPLFYNFTGSDWCGWCQLMDKKVFSQEAWQAYAAENLVLVWIDFPRKKDHMPAGMLERNDALAKQYKVEGYPTYIILAPDGETVIGDLGAETEGGPEAFVRSVQRVLLISKMETLLSAEDYAAWQALAEERKALETKVAKWQDKARKEAEAFQVAFKELAAKRNELLDKAVEANKK